MYSHIISKPHSVDAVMLCTKLVEPLEKPAQKEFTFGMTRRTLTDRQVANMGTTNLLVESAYTSEKYHQDMLKRLFAASEQAKRIPMKPPRPPQTFWSTPRKTASLSGTILCPASKCRS